MTTNATPPSPAPGSDHAVASRLPELLAPAGSPEAGYAALHYGADAIYLGLKRHSARAEAVNFSPAEFAEITAFAHSLTPRRRVFVTVNTVVLEAELPDLAETLTTIADGGADAVIVQDLGVARILRRHFPHLELHASTQMAIHNLEGARVARNLGFRRVTLARELTLDEVRDLAANAGVELETFIHGALCYCYSGLCLFSSHLCARSGNRGRCAYPCRDLFRVTGLPDAAAAAPGALPTRRDGFAFSMKDLALADLIPDLAAAGVACLKIEGRMKSPLYVAAVTDLYRRILDGRMPAAERAAAEEDLRTIFSRPWTPLFARGRHTPGTVDPEMVGHRGAAAGEASGVVMRQARRCLLFRTQRALEVHDGLQVEIAGQDKPFGFAVEALFTTGQVQRTPFSVPAGTEVAVPLPADAPDVPVGTPVFCASSMSVKRAFPYPVPKPGLFRQRQPVRVSVTLAADELRATAAIALPALEAAALSAEIAHPGPFTAAKNPAGSEAAVRAAFARLGDTPFALDAVELRNPHNLFAPASLLNAVRRDLMQRLAEGWQQTQAERLARLRADLVAAPATATPAARGAPPAWSIKIDDPAVVRAFTPTDWEGVEELVLDIGAIPAADCERVLEKLRFQSGLARLRVALPLIVRAWDREALTEWVHRAAAAGVRHWEAANLDAWDTLRAKLAAGQELTTDWSVPVFNHLAAEQLLSLGAGRATLSPEDSQANLARLLATAGERLTVIVYQDTPLYVSESCPYANLEGRCPGPRACSFSGMTLASAKGVFHVLSRHCRTTVIGEHAFCLSRRLRELADAGARHLRVDFAVRRYTPADAVSVWRRVRAGIAIPGTHEGNWDRAV